MIVDKPAGWTSHDVINRMRRLCGTRSIGHLGTLDPLATGVLPLLIGDATRLARFYTSAEKTYEATIRFGFATTSYDREGAATSASATVTFDQLGLEAALESFRGPIMQMPPPVSAKKIKGVPAYRMDPAAAEAALRAVPVEVFDLQLLSFDGELATMRVHCSAGTYIRSIAHDLGVLLKCGAHIAELRRTQSGAFTIAQARTIEELQRLSDAGALTEALLPTSSLLPDIPNTFVDEVSAFHIRNGRDFSVSPFRPNTGTRYVKAVNNGDQVLAIGEMVLPNLYHPVIVFPNAA